VILPAYAGDGSTIERFASQAGASTWDRGIKTFCGQKHLQRQVARRFVSPVYDLPRSQIIGRSAHSPRAGAAKIATTREGKILIGRSHIATNRTKDFSAHFLARDCVLGEKYALATNKD